MKHDMQIKFSRVNLVENFLLFSTWFLLFFSGFYQIPFLTTGVPFFIWAKRILFGLYGIFLSGGLKFSKLSRLDYLFIGWVLINFLSWYWFRWDYKELTYRIIQVIWIFVLIKYYSNKFGFIFIEKFPIKYFSGLCFLIVLGIFFPEIKKHILDGFGGNRFGFSIWLFQFVFISLLVIDKENNFFKCLLYVAPIIFLQNLSGGRTGLFASIILMLIFFWGDKKRFIWTIFYLIGISILGFYYAKFAGLDELQTIVRVTPEIGGSYFYVDSPVFSYLDRVLSYRLSIMASAFSNFDIYSAIFGLGVNQFHGFMLSTPQEVHNVFLRTLGELGVFGLLFFLAILLYPFFIFIKDSKIRLIKIFMLVYLIIGCFHSEILLTAISTCMVFWFCYAEILFKSRTI